MDTQEIRDLLNNNIQTFNDKNKELFAKIAYYGGKKQNYETLLNHFIKDDIKYVIYDIYTDNKDKYDFKNLKNDLYYFKPLDSDMSKYIEFNNDNVIKNVNYHQLYDNKNVLDYIQDLEFIGTNNEGYWKCFYYKINENECIRLYFVVDKNGKLYKDKENKYELYATQTYRLYTLEEFYNNIVKKMFL